MSGGSLNASVGFLLAVLLMSVNGQSAFTRRSVDPLIAPRLSPIPPGSRGMKPDQVNIAGWNKAWTNLVNIAEQSFTPSMSRLVAVEVELVVGNDNAAKDELTLSIFDASGNELTSATELVQSSNCEHALFVLPEGGVEVSPGNSYRIRLRGGTTFGWKYVLGGYPKGEATFNSKPLLPKARSTFLFRTFGSE
jgi:hypothetical protein